MATLKHSKQRDAIMEYLRSSREHPTADMVYMNIRQEYPNISLGTVYRNLSLLSELGEIRKISTGSGPDHFDGDIHPHYHFICNKCNQITDLHISGLNTIDQAVGKEFGGTIEGHVTYFYGTCEDCLKKENN